MHQVVECVSTGQVDNIARQKDLRRAIPSGAWTRKFGIVDADTMEMSSPERLIAALEAAIEADGSVHRKRDVGHADLFLGSLSRTPQREREQALMNESVSALPTSRIEDDVATGASGSRQGGLPGSHTIGRSEAILRFHLSHIKSGRGCKDRGTEQPGIPDEAQMCAASLPE